MILHIYGMQVVFRLNSPTKLAFYQQVTKQYRKRLSYCCFSNTLFAVIIPISNEQIISSPFGAKDFVPRLDEQTPFVNRLRTGCLRG